MSKTHVIHEKMPRYSKEEIDTNIILNLTNFRTYGNAEIKIPKNSTILIVGQSGAGKTSILEAFIFLMYNGVPKPEKFGTKRCWGWLFMGNMIIYRQKDPGLLKVWKNGREYTQGNAQYEIYGIYGKQNVFLATSYLRQKEFSPFLHGSDGEKMEIIKAVAFRGAESDEIKEPIRAKSVELQQASLQVKTRLDMSIRQIQSFDQRNPSIIQQQVPENSEDVLRKVQEIRNLIGQLDI